MTTQPDLPLFLQTRPALVRTKDPLGSRRGSCWVQGSGRLGRQEAIVLRVVTAAPGSTARELARALDCGDVNVPARRLAGLAERGLVRRGPERRCAVTGMTAQTWYPIGTLPARRCTGSRAEPRDAAPISTYDAVALTCPMCGHQGRVQKASDKPAQCSRCGTIVPTGRAPAEPKERGAL
jgi:hypothetical protein